MVQTRPLRDPGFARRIAVETPEHVILEFELAGLGSRTAAALFDAAMVFGLLLLANGAVAVSGLLPLTTRNWAVGALILVSFGIGWGYFLLFEGLQGGRTPGKRRVGIRVVMDTGHPITFYAAAVRNLIRVVDVQPGVPLVGMLFVFFHRHNKRLGDLAAGTIVVRDRPQEISVAPLTETETPALEVGPPILSDDEFKLLEQFTQRADDLPHMVRLRFTHELIKRFADRVTPAQQSEAHFLAVLYGDELRKRRGRPPFRTPRGASATTGGALRFAALRRDVWDAFRRRAAEVQQQDIRDLTGNDVVLFAAQYREVAADLARARTYRTDPRVTEYLERVVAAGHNVLYGIKGPRRPSFRLLLLGEFPAAVLQSWRFVFAAFLLFVVPGLIGFAVIRERPDLAPEMMPPVVLARAESGVRFEQEGRGYAEYQSPYLPLVATSIVANNVQVAIGAFSLGITAGIGTAVVLIFNGLFFGAVMAVFANYGLAAWLLTFVAGHGVLELTAIFIAGAGGLLIGKALVVPGDLTRRDALVVHGRSAIRLVGAATALLVLAGTIEGFLSASGAPAAVKFGVSAASAVLLGLYLLSGRQYLHTSARGGHSAMFAPGTPLPTYGQGPQNHQSADIPQTYY